MKRIELVETTPMMPLPTCCIATHQQTPFETTDAMSAEP
jgi:hypothetical protein